MTPNFLSPMQVEGEEERGDHHNKEDDKKCCLVFHVATKGPEIVEFERETILSTIKTITESKDFRTKIVPFKNSGKKLAVHHPQILERTYQTKPSHTKQNVLLEEFIKFTSHVTIPTKVRGNALVFELDEQGYEQGMSDDLANHVIEFLEYIKE